MFRREEAIDVVESYDAIDSPFKVAAARRTLCGFPFRLSTVFER
jgi:hypothetical protein